MTAQIIVMNLQGVAVASDTAVSRRTENGLQSAGFESKIIRLPEPHKIAILHSGSTNLNNVPHMMHIRAWVNSLTKPLPTVQAYVDSYVRFSNADKALVPTSTGQMTIERLVQSFLDQDARHFKDLENSTYEPGMEWDERVAASHKAAWKHIREMREFYKGAPNYKGLTREGVTRAIAKSRKGFSDYLEQAFEGVRINAAQKKALLDLAVDVLLKVDRGPSDSTLHFVGFGTTEPYARLIKLVVRGRYAGKFVADVNVLGPKIGPAPKEVAVDCWAVAQNDAINTFMHGIHPRAHQTIRKLSLIHI